MATLARVSTRTTSPSRETARNPLTLRFQSERLEAEYLRDAYQDYAGPLRFGLLMGSVLFVLYAGVDRYLFGHFPARAVTVRAVTVTTALCVYALTRRPAFERWVHVAVSLLHVVTGFTMVYLTSLHHSYTGGLYAVLMFFALVGRAHFRQSTIINVLLLVLFAVLGTFDSQRAALVEVSMLFAGIVVVGFGSYIKERSDRGNFLLRRAAATARDRALAANRTKSTFLANMSHELRTPLNAIIGYGELLQDEMRDENLPQFDGDLSKIVSSGRHLLGLINDILDLSKVEAGKVRLINEKFVVSELVDGVRTTVTPLVERNGNDLHMEAGQNLGTMQSDGTRVRQILLNLLSNAAKFTRKGTISFEVKRTPAPDGGDQIAFTVSDTGIGMSQSQLERIFDAFRQADASTTRDFGGTGLGLTISRHFAELLGGDITVTSQLGRGSQFCLTLPALAPARPITVPPGQVPRD